MSGPAADEDLLALSIVEPDAFTAARNARAKELRAAKDKDRAAVVAKLPKPTWTSWALNVLAREHGDEIDAWLAAGDALDAALNGPQPGDREALREAQRGERAALGHAVDRAGAVLTGAGRKADDQAIQRLTGTLRAAVTDPEVRDRLVRGILAEDVDAPTFGFGFAAPAPAPADDNVVSMATARSSRAARKKGTGAAAKKAGSAGRSGSSPSSFSSADDDADAKEQARLEREEAEARATAAQAEARRLAEEEHAAEVARLEADIEARQADLDRRTAAAEEAEAAARSARDEADAADRALADARAALADLPPLDLE